ncbi:MAG TPA: hypothetical protein QGF95_12770 [Candidatus Latescibacteria bacterium]|jgi:hypothetical protein|nr:hypothetical protein [Candidatus Latescibacterota bacterium]HJP31416.1 hypothetical protein [Candidatus Latescibacterota bacterium]
MKGDLLALAALVSIWDFSTALAVEPVTRHHGRYEDFAEGTSLAVAVDDEGRLTLAPVPTALTETGSQRIWKVTATGEVLWIGTGDDGKLYRLQEGDEPQLLFDSPEVSLHALTAARDGGVYAGSSPDGILYHVGGDGAVETVARTESRYVWDVVADGKGLLVATGAPARVLHLEGGETETWFESTTDGHVRCLARAGSHWYVGTAVAGKSGDDAASRARIYEVDSESNRLLLETEYEEITQLLARGDTLFAAMTTAPAVNEAGGGSAEPVSALLRIGPDGGAYPIWQGVGIVVGLLATAESPLTVVLREPGRVLRLDTDGGNRQRLAHLDSLVPNSATLWRGHLVVGDGRSGRLARLTPAPGDSGWFESQVEDLGAHGQWGAIEWEADTPRGTLVRLHTRTGNGVVPDDSWSRWSEPLEESGARIPSPAARYLQYRVVLSGDEDRGPAVRRISFTARQTNLPPRIESLTTFAYRGNPQAPGPLPPQPPNGGGNSSFRLPQSKSLRLVRWKASDANDDGLRYRIYLRGEGQQTWKLVEEDVELSSVIWDTESMPEGMTQLRIVASDAEHNPASRALEDEYVSEPFPIDNSPPVVGLRVRQDGAVTVIEASFADQVSAVRGAGYSVDYEDHGPRLAAGDGLFDSRTEQAVFRLENLAPGEHVISVQAWDQLDNVGVARVMIDVE